jgi:hypothetical protein
MLRQHAMRDIDKDLRTVAAIRLAALRRAARAQERQPTHPLPSTAAANALRGEDLPSHSGWEFLLQVPA